MIPIFRLLVLFVACRNLAFARPGGDGKPRQSPYNGGGGDDSGEQTLTLIAGEPATCTTSWSTYQTLLYRPTTSISTISTNVPVACTSYIPVTVSSTIESGGPTTKTTTMTVTSTAYASTIVPTTYCYTSDVWSTYSYTTVVQQPSTIISVVDPVVTQYITSLASVGQTYSPSYSYSQCVLTSTITSSVVMAAVTCPAAGATLTLGAGGGNAGGGHGPKYTPRVR